MTTETKQSETPYIVTRDDAYHTSYFYIMDKSGAPVARIQVELDETGRLLEAAIKAAEEKANFIVRACNSHDTLIEVVRAMSKFDGRNFTGHLRDMAKEALKQAGVQ